MLWANIAVWMIASWLRYQLLQLCSVVMRIVIKAFSNKS